MTTPRKIIDEQHARSLLGAQSDSESLFVLATQYFHLKHSARTVEIVSAAELLVECATGRRADDNHPAGKYARQVIAGLSEGLDLASSELQTEVIFHLIETLYFKTRDSRAAARRARLMTDAHYGEPVRKPESEEDRKQVIREAIALLEATKSSFRSKLVAEAKERLQTLL